ncbi:hypothetical protein [Sediminicurvatus halobius]|uniref:Uncharacterized protein n=1 Tax=Sediminicurvatus halobius TaxID=2182432 RepID=A0A2U2N9Q2_9GAMM|nr:hypothetical protein [Spiribacter halobius]PWG65838.1 hypothetical protein DEM34_00815 [Spiribacter halobius]UEX77882.1 hypothetical protein LMH63_18450 [Spiribacter halobius]
MARVWRRIGVIVLVAILGRVSAVDAHPEHLPEHFVIDVHVRLAGEQVEVLVRTPLFLFANVGLPLRGEGHVDIRAFHSVDPHVEGDLTYAQRAANAVESAIRLSSAGELIELTTHDVRLSREENTAFGSYEQARTQVGAGRQTREVHHSRGFVDVRFVGWREHEDALAFTPTISPALAGRTTFRVTVNGGGRVRTHEIAGDGAAVRLLE